MKKLCLIIVLSLFATLQIIACTNFLVTKGASTDGSTFITYAADSHVLYGELYFWPAATYPEGTMMDIYEWDTGKYMGQIPQATQTYSVVGLMNEYQVSIGETTYGGRSELGKQPDAIMDYGSLMFIGLQRSKSAREAIKVISGLMAKYGYASVGESFSILDKNEVWIMELIGKGEGQKGAVWVARLVPDGYICGHANQARITTFPLANGKTSISSDEIDKIFNPDVNTVYAADVISFARDKGWFEGKDKDFSFSDIYAPVGFGGARFCEIRVWAMFRDVKEGMDEHFEYVQGHIQHNDKFADGSKNPNGFASNRMPLWIKPDKKISVQDMMNYMRDHLEGTPLDMTQDIGAGPYQVPYRWRPLTWKVDSVAYCNERATATQQTGFSFVSQGRSWLPDPVGGIYWFGIDDAASTVYIPMYCGVTEVPEKYARGYGAMMEWEDDAAFWVFNQVSNFTYTRYNVIHPEVQHKQQAMETESVAMIAAIDKVAEDLYARDKDLAVDLITNFSVDLGNRTVTEWKKFYQYLFMRYMDGNIKEPVPGEQNPKVEQPGYGEDWYRVVVKKTGEQFKVIGSTGH